MFSFNGMYFYLVLIRPHLSSLKKGVFSNSFTLPGISRIINIWRPPPRMETKFFAVILLLGLQAALQIKVCMRHHVLVCRIKIYE